MNSANWNKLKEAFNQAIDLPVEQRVEFVKNCNEELQGQLKNLIEAHEQAGEFIAEPAMVEVGLTDETDANLGKRIDDYEIESEIGHGGMGAVYLARHKSESFTQMVAVKLIKRGMDTDSVLKRFVIERQILANLEHPNIARLLDVGTNDGLPYFVMEYIEGSPVTRFCDANRYSIEDRLRLFRKICAAVQYAHQNLVIHRDIKPSNILVTKDGTPKLLDFGIAKLLNPDWATDTTEATATMMRLLTPEYASPEQLRGAIITTASDVYSLGVVLYELLSGQRPFKFENDSREDFIQAILTEEPVKPSAIVSSARQPSALGRKTDKNNKQPTTSEEQSKNPKSEIRNPKSLQGDLDNIILKALRKEPERRYVSAQEFSEDIRRHLMGLPVTATADTTFYRFNKFVKRHQVGVLVGCLMILVLLSATAVTAWQSIVAKRERDRAEQRFRQVRQLTNSFMFEFHDSIRDLSGSLAARELVAKKALEYLDSLASEQTSDASLKYELAIAYQKVGDIQGRAQSTNIGDTRGALESYRKSAEIFEALYATDPTNSSYRTGLADAYEEIATINQLLGEFDAALETTQKAIVLLEAQIADDPRDVTSIINLGNCYKGMGDLTGSKGDIVGGLRYYRRVSEMSEATLKIAPDNKYVNQLLIVSYDAIGTTLGNPNFTNLGDAAGALEAYRKQLELCRKMLAQDKDNYNSQFTEAFTLKVIGEVLTTTGDWEAALETYGQSLKLFNKILPSDSKDAFSKATLAYLHTNIGEALAESGQTVAALEHHRQAIEELIILTETDKENSMYVNFLARAYQRKGDALVKANKIESAIESYSKALTSDERMANEDSENMDIRWALAADYRKIGKANYAMAMNSALNKRSEFLREAGKRFEQSRAVYQYMQAHNLKIKPISNALDNLEKEIAMCGAALAKL